MPKLLLNFKSIKEKENIYINIISIFLFLLLYLLYYTPQLQDPAGYISTALNYTWPFYFSIIHFYLLKTLLNIKGIKTFKKGIIYFLAFFSLIFAINHEMMIIIVGGIYFFIFAYFIYKKVKIRKIMFLFLFIIFLVFLMEYLSPGNKARSLILFGSNNIQIPIFKQSDLGILSFLHTLISRIDFISYIFFAILGIYTVFIFKNKKIAIFSFIPFSILTISYFKNCIPPFESLIDLININNSIYISILFILTTIYSLILIYYSKKKLISLLV
jgi:hypothetical protein